MPLLRLNVVEGQIQCPENAAEIHSDLIEGQLRLLGSHDPVVILLHGYRYSPRCRYRDPHKLILSREHQIDGPRRIGVSWPCALGYTSRRDRSGLCFPVSWDARGPLRDVYHRAEEVGRHIAGILDLIAAQDPHRPVHLMAHSLGARVALAAISAACSPVLRRLILLAPADFEVHAARALNTDGAAALEVLQVSPAENRVFDLLLSQGLGAGRPVGPTLGCSEIKARNWVRLGIDTAEDLAHLKELGLFIGARTSRVCHWSSYLRPGLMSLYSACLSGAGSRSFASFDRQS